MVRPVAAVLGVGATGTASVDEGGGVPSGVGT